VELDAARFWSVTGLRDAVSYPLALAIGMSTLARAAELASEAERRTLSASLMESFTQLATQVRERVRE
jgi:hypothetical protein